MMTDNMPETLVTALERIASMSNEDLGGDDVLSRVISNVTQSVSPDHHIHGVCLVLVTASEDGTVSSTTAMDVWSNGGLRGLHQALNAAVEKTTKAVAGSTTPGEMMAHGIGNFGQRASYNLGDAVWVKGCPRDGVAHIVRINDGGFHPTHTDLKCDKGTYEIEYNSGAGVLMVPVEDLKPAKPDEDAKDQAKVSADRERHQDAVARNARLLEKLLTCEPLAVNENDSMSFMSGMFGMMQSLAGGDLDSADLEALRFQDAVAVNMGRSLGYCGAPRADYAVGERVRIRQGLKPGFWGDRVPGMTGTVMEPGLLSIFPVSPVQPKGIAVEWDDGTKTSIYVTNLEPE